MKEVIVIASGKGGVGKTVFTANMGAVLAQRNAKVLILDMNMGLRNLDLCLGMESRVVYDVADVLFGVCRLKQALIRDRRFPELYLMSAAQGKEMDGLEPTQVKALYEQLKTMFDYVIVDAPTGIGRGLELAATGADRAVIVTVPEYASLRDADMVDRFLIDYGIRKKKYVVNKVKADLFGQGSFPSLEEMAEVLRMEMAGVVQYDENIHIAANNGVPIVYKKGTYVSENFNHIVDRILK